MGLGFGQSFQAGKVRSNDSPERREGGIPRAKGAYGINVYSTGSVPRKRQSFNLTSDAVKVHAGARPALSPRVSW